MEHQEQLPHAAPPVAPWLKRLTFGVLLIAALYHLYLVAHPFLPWSGTGIKIFELTQVQRATHVFFLVLAGYLLTARPTDRGPSTGAFVFAILSLPMAFEFVRLDIPLAAKAVGLVFWALAALPGLWPRVMRYSDLLMGLLAFVPFVYLIREFEDLIYRAVLPEAWDLAMGFGLTIAVLGLAFRWVGPVLPGLVLVFLTYNLYGHTLPGVFSTAGMPLDMLVGKLFSETEAGLFGIITNVSIKYLVFFTMLGGVITALGFGPIIARLALRAVGRSPQAPGRSVGLMSVFMGLFSGSGAADTQFVATVTKPMMERSGYDRYTAAGLTATAGSIALITPPVLGSIAFVMVELLNIPYTSIIVMALGPCILYLAGVWFYNEFYTRKMGFDAEAMPVDQGKVAKYLYVFLPLLLIMGALYFGINISLAVALAIVAFVVLAFIDPSMRRGTRNTFAGLADGIAHLVPIGAAVVSANIIMTLMVLTGLPSKVSQFLTLVSNSNLLLATVLAAVFSLILGMGVPPIATYVLTSALVAPALVELAITNGIPETAALLSTHMFLFYYAILADVTPPVALSAFAASSVWGTDPIRTGIFTARVALPKYFLGLFFIMAYHATAILIVPVLSVSGNAAWPIIIWRFAATILGVMFISASTVGYTRHVLQRWETWVLGVAGVAMLSPYWWLNAPALLVGAYFFLRSRGQVTARGAS